MKVVAVASNIMGRPKMPIDHAIYDMELTLSCRGVTFWCEISNKKYKSALRALTTGRLRTQFLDTATPITYDGSEWNELFSRYVKAHRGRATATPARGISILGLGARLDNTPVVFMGTHFASGAWNGKRKTFKKWRKKMWLRHWNKMHDLVHEYHSLGFTVVGGGDFNKTDVAKFHRDQVWYKTGIIKIFVVPSKNDVVKHTGGDSTTANYSDHAIVKEVFAIHSK